MTAPIVELRRKSPRWRNTDVTPSHTLPDSSSTRVLPDTVSRSETLKSITCVSEKIPRKTGTMPWPSSTYCDPKVYRVSAVRESSPTNASMRPKPAIESPLISEPRVTAAKVVRPHIANIKNSGGPRTIMSSRITGISKTRMPIPNVDPRADADAEHPMAVFARPAWDIGYPSNKVAAFEFLPGTLKRIEVTDPMKVAPPSKAPNSSIIGTGSHENVNGMARAMRVAAPTPGITANTIANRVPTTG